MNETELRQMHDIINDVWKLLKANTDTRDDDEYWDNLISAGNDIWERHDRHPLSMIMVSAVCEYLDKEHQRKKERK